jgi:hypothetical protein
MKRLTLVLMIASLLALGGTAFADLCTIDAVPAATLLLPNFEVDTTAANGAGLTTLFSINNASAAPALAHVTLWTDWSVPTVDFDIYLTGYDVVTVNLYDVVVNGNIPITADLQSDPGDGISPNGGHSSWDGSFTNCGAFFPNFNNPVITGSILDRVFNGHQGNFVAAVGGYMGQTHNNGDGVARGYVTIDNALRCSTDFASDPDYFDNGNLNAVASNVNQLWGDWFKADFANDFAQGDNLVHIEADDAFNADTGALPASVPPNPTNYTFYGRFTQDEGGDDNREPLGTTWATRYINGGAFDGSSITVWRDSTQDTTTEAYSQNVGPDWNPLNETQIVCFSEQEDAEELCFSAGGGVISPPTGPDDPACIPLETNVIAIGDGALSPSWNFGWCYYNLNLPPDAITGDVDFPIGGGLIAQSHMAVTHSAAGVFSVGLNAIELTSACEDVNPLINPDAP